MFSPVHIFHAIFEMIRFVFNDVDIEKAADPVDKALWDTTDSNLVQNTSPFDLGKSVHVSTTQVATISLYKITLFVSITDSILQETTP